MDEPKSYYFGGFGFLTFWLDLVDLVDPIKGVYSLHKIHMNVLLVPDAHPMATRIHAAVPPAPLGGGPAAKL